MIIIIIIVVLIILIGLFVYNKKESFSEGALNIYVVTLPSRRAHVNKFVNSFKTDNDNVYIVDAIIDKDTSKACSMSHTKVLNMINNNRSNNLNIIFEDDVLVEKDSRKIIDKFINKVSKYHYDILYGGFYKDEDPKIVEILDNLKIYRLTSPRTTHCYIIRKDLANTLINIINSSSRPIDELIATYIYNNKLTAYGIYFFKQPWQKKTID